MNHNNPSIEFLPIILADGTKIFTEVTVHSGEEEVGLLGKVFNLNRVTNIISSLSSNVMSAVKKAKPTKASVELQLSIGLESGELTAFWVKGEGEAQIKLTLEWENLQQQTNDES